MAIKALKQLKVSKRMYRNMPFVAFLACLAMMYIANAHRGEHMMREVQNLEEHAKQERWRYMSVKSEVTSESICSRIEHKVADAGLRVPVVPPKTITVK